MPPAQRERLLERGAGRSGEVGGDENAGDHGVLQAAVGMTAVSPL
jgi:hypothetical protein